MKQITTVKFPICLSAISKLQTLSKLVFPLLLIFTSGCAIYEKRSLPEWRKTGAALPLHWSDQQSPALELLVSNQCARFIEEGKTVGLAVAVVAGTNSTIVTFGRPSLFSDQPIQTNTLFEIGSITKTFTALALANEIERGKMRLDQPIEELLPVGLQLPQNVRGVTLRQLTTHTSGFPPQPDNISLWHGTRQVLRGRNPYAGYSETQFCKAIATVYLQSPPGTKMAYSNFGVDVLGYLLTENAGTNYEAYIKREICEPLGLHDTTVTLTPEQTNRFAQGYLGTERKRDTLAVLRTEPWDLPSHLAGSGALRSSVSDLFTYLKANMHPEGPLAPAISASHQELFRQNERSGIGMNWIRSKDKKLGTVLWHNGAMGGGCGFLGFTENRRVGVVILSNVGSERVDELAWKLLREVGMTAPDSNRLLSIANKGRD